MTGLKIVPFEPRDDAAALSLEEKCVQGKSIVLKFQRPTFDARSKVYDHYKIVCAWLHDELIGIGAYAKKTVSLHGETVIAIYIYDLRVHPDHRKCGVAKRLVDALLQDIGADADCIYSLVAGENMRALSLIDHYFKSDVVIPLTYAIIPVHKGAERTSKYSVSSLSEIHKMFLQYNLSVVFVPPTKVEKMSGYVTSIVLEGEQGGCSIWTNENLLAEQVVALSGYFRLLKVFTKILGRFFRFPHIPVPGENIHSWFLFDLFGRDKDAIRSLIGAVNNIALAKDRTYLYILLQSDDPMLKFLKGAGLKIFTLPYLFMAKGRLIPSEKDRLYIDVRDL